MKFSCVLPCFALLRTIFLFGSLGVFSVHLKADIPQYDPPEALLKKRDNIRKWAALAAGAISQETKRQVPKVTLDSLAGDFLRQLNVTREQIVPLIVYLKRVKPLSDLGFTLNPEEAWQVVEPGAFIYISDRSNYHITTVYEKSVDGNYLLIADPWPEASFLLKKENVLGLQGELIEREILPGQTRKLIKLSREDWEIVTIGFFQQEAADAFPKLLSWLPRLNNPQDQFRLVSLLGYFDYFPYLQQLKPVLLSLVSEEALKSLNATQAGRLHQQLAISALRESEPKDKFGLNAAISKLESTYGRDSLLRCYSSNEWAVLGHAHAMAKEMSVAAAAFDKALLIDPQNTFALNYRSSMAIIERDWTLAKELAKKSRRECELKMDTIKKQMVEAPDLISAQNLQFDLSVMEELRDVALKMYNIASEKEEAETQK